MPELTDKQRNTAKAMSEEELYKEVAERLKKLGWRYFHIPATAYRHGVRAGFPDITAVRRGRLLFAELKREGGNPSSEQLEWLDALRQHDPHGVYIWWPSNLLSGEIAEALA